VTAPRWAGRCASTARTWPWSTSGCPPRTPTRGCAPPSRPAGQSAARAVLVLSQYVEVAYADELLADGAGGVGYLLKDRVADVSTFLSALEDVVGGGTVLDPQVVAQLFARRRRTTRSGG
jgi:hypothetical protein